MTFAPRRGRLDRLSYLNGAGPLRSYRPVAHIGTAFSAFSIVSMCAKNSSYEQWYRRKVRDQVMYLGDSDGHYRRRLARRSGDVLFVTSRSDAVTDMVKRSNQSREQRSPEGEEKLWNHDVQRTNADKVKE